MEPVDLLPAHAAIDLGPTPSGNWGGVPWPRAIIVHDALEGLVNGKAVLFRPGHSALLTVSDCDIDTDGPGGSRDVDSCWQGQTSLRYLDGSSCDSRKFPGVVIPPVFRAEYGVNKGDFCLAFWHGAVRSAQVYDFGPPHKDGEISICLGRGLGIVKPTESDHHASTAGNNVRDLVILAFPGSGSGRAVALSSIIATTRDCWNKFTSR